MDNFTFGMFSEMDDYNAREEAREFAEWDRMEAEDEFDDEDEVFHGGGDYDDYDDEPGDYYGEQDFG